MRFILVITSLVLVSCASVPEKKVEVGDLNLKPSSFSQMPGWADEDFEDFGKAYRKSCEVLLKRDSQRDIGKNQQFGKNQEWQILCRKFNGIRQSNISAIKEFFESNFIPHQVFAGSNPKGLFTGYYEASLKGSRTKAGPYQVPLRARPDDLVMVQLGDFREELKGQRIAGRVIDGRLRVYETHEEIISGELPLAQDKPLVWVDSAVDAFFLQIQGSGVIELDDGSIMRVGYAGQNGHPYYAIGRELIARGALTKENVSMQSIRAWLEANPSEAREVMTTNKSYVFFQENKAGATGGSGLELTPGRSLAIDHSLLPYHLPIYLNTDVAGEGFNRLMVTQDTGGAIRGPVRGDIYFGYGDEAERLAGAQKSQGQYWVLIPKNL
ncbi:MAG: murein transglycosylase A [Pseudomonadota bacterium]